MWKKNSFLILHYVVSILTAPNIFSNEVRIVGLDWIVLLRKTTTRGSVNNVERRSGIEVKGKVLCIDCAERSGDGRAPSKDISSNTIYKCSRCGNHYMSK